jgi:DNA-binding winged helix-turn-helix (wHTH) protein/predicted ATPase
MLPARYFFFDRFRLDVVDERLWAREKNVSIGHKAFALLARLIVQPGRFVSKVDLLTAAWPETAVTDAVLTTAMRELRQALDDDARNPRFIETVHRRGYRFIAPVVEANTALTVGEPPHRLVGRQKESARIQESYASALQGTRRIVFIAGEAGIGKTALVEQFVSDVVAHGKPLIAQGQCIEHYGAGEAYLPILESLGRLGREPNSLMRGVLHQHAPSWLLHLPSIEPAQHSQMTPVTPARMFRELADALEALTAQTPLILILEDLHWSDTATLEWLAYAARRRDPARLLVLTTYRPEEMLPLSHALRKLIAEMRQQSQCVELLLDCLSDDAVHAYLQQRCGSNPRLAGAARVLCRRTGGHPLFLRAIVDELVHRSTLDNIDLSSLGSMVPAGVRQFIENRFDALSVDDKEILEVASVVGDPFSVAAVAAVMSVLETSIESQCAAWQREGSFVAADGAVAWGDGRITTRYRFRHALYQEVVYTGISPERRAQLHRVTGDRLEAHYGGRTAAIAAELAVHFEHGRDPDRAVSYLAQAARKAVERSAYAEARFHLERGQKMLELLPEGEQRLRRELEIMLLLGRVLAAREGWAVAQVEKVFLRARDICDELGDDRGLLQALWGLIGVTFAGADFRKARSIGRHVLGLAKRSGDPICGVLGHMEVGGTGFHLGESALASSRHFAKAESLYNMRQHGSHLAYFGVDMGLFSRSWATHFLWHKGYLDRARAKSDETLKMAGELAHPFSLVVASAYATMLHQFRRDRRQVDALSESTIRLCNEHGFQYYLAWCEVLRGWSRCVLGNQQEGIAEIRRGIGVLEATAGARLSYYRALLAEASASQGCIDEAWRALDEAFADIRKTGERWWESELHRLRGELLLSDRRNDCTDAEACFQQAIEAARGQQAKPLELRAALCLARLWRVNGRRSDAYTLVKKVRDWFRDGIGDADMQTAEPLLAEFSYDPPQVKGAPG